MLLKLPFRKKSNLPVSLQLRGCLNTSFLRGSMMTMEFPDVNGYAESPQVSCTKA